MKIIVDKMPERFWASDCLFLERWTKHCILAPPGTECPRYMQVQDTNECDYLITLEEHLKKNKE